MFQAKGGSDLGTTIGHVINPNQTGLLTKIISPKAEIHGNGIVAKLIRPL